jgi:hypothetical protein
VLLVAASVSPPAAANGAVTLFRGQRHGPLAPQRSTNVRVDREDLLFDLLDLYTARVTASYRLTAAAAENADVAFAFVRDMSGPIFYQGLPGSVEVDGTPVDAETATDGQILEPRLRAWLDARPELRRALRAAAEEAPRSTDPDRPLREAGGPCAGGCRALLEWSQMVDEHDPGISMRREWALDAAREVIPEAVEELQRGWCTLPERHRLVFLLFRLDFSAGQTRSVTVRYEHVPTVDRRTHAPGVRTFEYLLSPAKRWAAFGPLDVTVRLPDQVAFSSPRPFRHEGGALRASFDTLPDGELTFSVMSTKGLWLGLSRHGAYWAVLAAALGLAGMLSGAAFGTLLSRGPRRRRVLLSLLFAGPLSALAALAVLLPLQARLPQDALGFDDDYSDGLRPARPGFLVRLAAVAGAVAAVAVSTALARRRAVRPTHEKLG